MSEESAAVTVATKTCKGPCGLTLPLDMYYQDKKSKRRRPYCRSCFSAKMKEWRKANHKRFRAIQNKSYLKHREKRIAESKANAYKYREKFREYMKVYDAKRKDDPVRKARKIELQQMRRAACEAQRAEDKEHADKVAAADAYVKQRLAEIAEALANPKPKVRRAVTGDTGISVPSFSPPI